MLVEQYFGTVQIEYREEEEEEEEDHLGCREIANFFIMSFVLCVVISCVYHIVLLSMS